MYQEPEMENSNTHAVTKESRLLDLEKYRLKLKLREAGVEWHEDHKGKFKIWVRLSTTAASAQY